MSVVDLTKRVTDSWDQYNENMRSYESSIYIRSDKDLVLQSNSSVNLTIGDIWYNGESHANIKMDDKGVKVKPKKYIVFSTEQRFGIPRNVFGIVVGKGINIFNGGVIATGKIVPGYSGELKIGYYNASESTVILHKGDLLGCCIFFNTESTVTNEYIEDIHENAPAVEQISKKRKIWECFRDNWYNIVSIIVSVVAIIISLCK